MAQIATVPEIVEEARNGRMFILVDDEDRENEGDLVIPAQMATPEAINFMARFGRGLICLALTGTRVAELGLRLMNENNRSRFETAFAVSIEARTGVTTGISPSDRARTIATAINLAATAEDIITPGHVFPLKARDGGVLVRAGHTEAAVDVARLAGLYPAGVICEIIRDDGEMATMPDLVRFAQSHSLKIGTIRDLIAYRLRHDQIVLRSAETTFQSHWGGLWRVITYVNAATDTEQVALVKGEIDPTRPALVRMHSLDLFADLLADTSERRGLLHASMEMIAAHGSGVVVLINRRSASMMQDMVSAYGKQTDSALMAQRDYGVGAQILAELGVHDMELLSNHQHAQRALAGYGLRIVGQRAIPVGDTAALD